MRLTGTGSKPWSSESRTGLHSGSFCLPTSLPQLCLTAFMNSRIFLYLARWGRGDITTSFIHAGSSTPLPGWKITYMEVSKGLVQFPSCTAGGEKKREIFGFFFIPNKMGN